MRFRPKTPPPPSTELTSAAAPAVVLALLAVALGWVVGRLLAVALLLAAVARLLVVAAAGRLAVARALRAAPIAAKKNPQKHPRYSSENWGFFHPNGSAAGWLLPTCRWRSWPPAAGNSWGRRRVARRRSASSARCRSRRCCRRLGGLTGCCSLEGEWKRGWNTPKKKRHGRGTMGCQGLGLLLWVWP